MEELNSDKNQPKVIHGNIVDVIHSEIYPALIFIRNGIITEIIQEERGKFDTYIIPGFIDSHIHTESSMLPPAEFGRIAAVHGTIAVISDPHEIANVSGMNGIEYILQNAKNSPIKTYFAAPSCVPATNMETSGALLTANNIETLLKKEEFKSLGEVMNIPAVLAEEKHIIKKIKLAHKYSKIVDGHAPSLSGADLKKYIDKGISTDHESTTYDEALEKINKNMKIQIREGSAAKNFDSLMKLIDTHPNDCMLCSDDKHPDDLAKGHINLMVKKAVTSGIDIMKVLKVACVNPAKHYKLDTGLLRIGDAADFLEVDNLTDFNILKTYINGEIVAEADKPVIQHKQPEIINNFKARKIEAEALKIHYQEGKLKVIEITDGELLTKQIHITPKEENGFVTTDLENDILKIVVLNRYQAAKPAIGFIKNFGLKKGAIASSIAHDSHNIIAIGTTDKDICNAINIIVRHQGGICAVAGEKGKILPLPIAGLMSDKDYHTVATDYTKINKIVKHFGSPLKAPFMTLSFMGLLVIPELKISDKGLFDVTNFKFTDIFV